MRREMFAAIGRLTPVFGHPLDGGEPRSILDVRDDPTHLIFRKRRGGGGRGGAVGRKIVLAVLRVGIVLDKVI